MEVRKIHPLRIVNSENETLSIILRIEDYTYLMETFKYYESIILHKKNTHSSCSKLNDINTAECVVRHHCKDCKN